MTMSPKLTSNKKSNILPYTAFPQISKPLIYGGHLPPTVLIAQSLHFVVWKEQPNEQCFF